MQLNLKSAGSVNDSDGLCSQSNQLENESFWDESNLAASGKKKRKSVATNNNGDEENKDETPARRRSR